MAQEPLVGQGFLITEASRSHSDAPHSVGLLWKSDQPLPDHTQHSQQISVPPDGIRTRIPSKLAAADHASDLAATEISNECIQTPVINNQTNKPYLLNFRLRYMFR